MSGRVTLTGLAFVLLGAIGIAAPFDCPHKYCAMNQGNCLVGCPPNGMQRCDALSYSACVVDVGVDKECANGTVICVCHNYNLPNCAGPVASNSFVPKPGNCSDADC